MNRARLTRAALGELPADLVRFPLVANLVDVKQFKLVNPFADSP